MTASLSAWPALLLCAGSDKILSVDAIHEFYGNAGQNMTMLEYPGGYHCLHFDTVYQEVLGAILVFLRG
jgi:alpha-beta hydrolase superfamily lysophospholipase